MRYFHRGLSILLGIQLAFPIGKAAALDFNNETISGNVVLPANETHRFFDTITLDDAVVDVFGYLRNEQNPVTVTGSGQINLHYSGGVEGIWTDGWTSSFVTIHPGIEVQAAYDTSFSVSGINQGTIAAVPGENYGTAVNSIDMLFSVDDFTNEGLIEVRPEGIMRMVLRGSGFQNNGTIRVQPDGHLKLVANPSDPLTPQSVGAIENHGLTTLQAYIEGIGSLSLNGTGTYEIDRYTTFINGTLNIAPTVTARVISQPANEFRLSNATINGNLESKFLTDTTIENGLTLNGQWEIGQADLNFGDMQTIDGNATFVSSLGLGEMIATGTGDVTFDPSTVLKATSNATMRLRREVAGTSFRLRGETLADGGTFSTSAGGSTNWGTMRALNQGELELGRFSTAFTNHATIEVTAGGSLFWGEGLTNLGTITVDQGSITLEQVPLSGVGTTTITDSTIFAAAFQQKLSDLLALSRTRSEIVTAGSFYGDQVDLEGGTLTIADADNQRWAMHGGGIQKGTIESADGFELRTVSPVGVPSSNIPVLRNVVLNADVRVTSERALQVNENVTGSGKIILDGGRVQVNGFGNQGAPMTSEVLGMIEPEPTAENNLVDIYGNIDNTGRTIYLKEGAEWWVRNLRQDGIVGGRIEGDAGVELQMLGGYGSNGLATIRGVTLAVPTNVPSNTYVRDGLTLDGAVVSIGSPMSSTQQQGSTGRLIFLDPQTLNGMGEIHFVASANPNNGFSEVIVQSGPLEIGSDIVLRTWTADGTIAGAPNYSSPPTTLVPADLTLHGMFVAKNGHTLTLATDNFAQLGTLRTEEDSSIEVFDANLHNQGRLEFAGGQMSFSGQLSQSSTGTMSFDLETNPLDPAGLEVSGDLLLDGVLEAQFADTGFVPAAGDSFQLAEVEGEIVGAFSTMQLPALTSGLSWILTTDSLSLYLEVTTGGLPGDFNGDDRVDGVDLLAIQQGTPSDIADWQAYYGKQIVSVANVQRVPEPMSVLLMLAGVFKVLGSRVTARQS